LHQPLTRATLPINDGRPDSVACAEESVVERRVRSARAAGAKLRRDPVLHRMRLARLVAAPAAQRSTDSPVHREHRLEIHDFGMREDLECVLQFVSDQRNQPVVIDARRVRRHDDAKVTPSGRWHHEGQQTAIQMAKRAMTEFDVDNAVCF